MRENRWKSTGKGKSGVLWNLMIVSSSNVMQLIANIAIGLLLPMVLGVADFGYYKIYTLYVGYCGLMHFGFIDGILLKYGGMDYETLDQPTFRTYTRLFFLSETLCSILIVFIGLILLDDVYRVIAVLVGSNLVPMTVSQYYQYLSQATSRFKEFSLRKVLNAFAIISLTAALFVIKKYVTSNIAYWTVILALQSISFCLLVWYIWTYREITFGKGVPVGNVLSNVVEICRKGFLLTIAYEVAQFILLLDRQFVSVFFSIETYAQYAFAYNLLSCVTALITAISTVMFPMLKRMKKSEAVQLLPMGVSVVTTLVCFSLTGYYVVAYIIDWLIPQYHDALRYFRIVFPAMALSSSITIIIFTFYKVLDRIADYFKKSILALVVSFALNIIAYFIWKTPEMISVASVLSIVIWYILVSKHLAGACNVEWKKNFLYALSMMAGFYLTLMLPCTEIIKCAVYFAIFCVISWYVHRNMLNELGTMKNVGE